MIGVVVGVELICPVINLVLFLIQDRHLLSSCFGLGRAGQCPDVARVINLGRFKQTGIKPFSTHPVIKIADRDYLLCNNTRYEERTAN